MNYPISTSNVASASATILQKKIDEGRGKARRVFEHVHSTVPKDAIVGSLAMNFTAGEGTPLLMQWGSDSKTHEIHRNALGQIADRAGIPAKFLGELASGEGWQTELAAHTLNKHFRNLTPSRNLVRSVGSNQEVRGFLSDKYKRLENRSLLETFIEATQEAGALPLDGTASATRTSLKAILPHVFEPIPGEALGIGIEQFNSDFGCGKYGIRGFIYRLVCLNGATTEDVLAQVHLGGRIDDAMEFSERTYQLDTELQVSATQDVVRAVLGAEKVTLMLETIKSAAEKSIDWRKVSGRLAKTLLKNEYKLVHDAFESEDVINLPAGKSVWRVSNAISWIAGHTENEDRKLELERLAGAVLTDKKLEEVAA